MNALGIRVNFKPAKWPENLKNARAGKLMIWSLGSSAASPDGGPSFDRAATSHKGGQNLSRFSQKQFDELYTRIKTIPDGPERERLFLEGKRILTAYAPYKHHVHRILTDLTWPWVIGFRRPPYWLSWWQYVDIDTAAQARRSDEPTRLPARHRGRGRPRRRRRPRRPRRSAAGGKKVLRYAFPIAETGFDPAQVIDLYSRIICSHIFDSPYTYDHLARPFKIKPNTAVGMPESSSDFRTWTVRLRPGIFFDDDPAFGGKPRELVAADYLYSLKRVFDPRWKSPGYATASELKIRGLEELRSASVKNRTPFPYDVRGRRPGGPDRHTLQLRLEDPQPRLLQFLAGDLLGAVAREVVERYGDDIMGHPVGTGPFRLVDWRRSSRMVLERNPRYRDHCLRRGAQRRRRRRPGHGAAVPRPEAADGGPRRGVGDRGSAAALALVPEQAAGPAGAAAERIHQRRRSQRQARAEPGEAGRAAVPGAGLGRHRDHLQHGRPGRRRIQRPRRSRCAGRSAWA